MSEPKYREAYESGYGIGYGDGAYDASRRVARSNAVWFLAGAAFGAAAMLAARILLA